MLAETWKQSDELRWHQTAGDVSPSFYVARRMILERNRSFCDEEMVARLADLLARHCTPAGAAPHGRERGGSGASFRAACMICAGYSLLKS
jgi:hypothetical protein